MRLLLEQPVRMLSETRVLVALASEDARLTNLAWGLTPSGEVRVNFDVTIREKVYEAVLIYPDLFPQAPAYVRPRNIGEVWTTHRYPTTGTLCLEWGPDTWHPDVTGADLVRSTIKLLAFEEFGAALGLDAPSRHELTPGQLLRGKHSRFVATQGLWAAIDANFDKPCTELTTYTSGRFSDLVALATKVGDDSAPALREVPKEFSDLLALGAWLRKGWVIRVKDCSKIAATVSTQSVLRQYLKDESRWPWSSDDDRSAFLVLVDDSKSMRVFATSDIEGGPTYEYHVVDAAASVAARQPARNAGLAEKRIAIVGLGSVGSKLAVSLAREGVSRFLLVDDDVLLPGNLSRNQLDWQSVGYDKVDAVHGAICLVRPNADVQTRVFRFVGQESSSYNTSVLEQVAKCDLVIDATANSKVFASLAAICTRRKVALVWGEVFAGGIGALMARSIPGRDAEPLAIRAAINSYLATLPEAPFKRAEGYDVDDGHEVHMCGDGEVSHLAASLTQFAVDALLAEAVLRFPVAAYLMGYQQAWAFEAPFHTHAITCPPASLEDSVALDAQANATAFDELISVFTDNKC
jgi:molybdopterin/thiamine biosynthesis adenylyltransferase